MRFWLVLACACGTAASPSVPRRAAPPVAEPPPAAPSDAVAGGVLRDAPTRIELDTSIATVWGYDPNRRESPTNHYAPPPAPTPIYDRVITPGEMPRARVPGRRAPCFPKRDVLVAYEIANDLEPYQVSIAEDETQLNLTPTPYGTCRAHNDELRDARGKLIAEFSCGVAIHVKGIIDNFGFEIGAAGKDVAAAHTEGEPVCVAEGTKHTRCWFTTKSGNDGNSYSFAVPPALDEDGLAIPIRGAEARTIFDENEVTQIFWRGSCH